MLMRVRAYARSYKKETIKNVYLDLRSIFSATESEDDSAPRRSATVRPEQKWGTAEKFLGREEKTTTTSLAPMIVLQTTKWCR